MAVIRHPDSWVEPHQLGGKRPYRPTHSESLTLGPTHRRLLDAPLKPGSVAIDIGIPGSLRREDAAKLYELAYFGQGDACVLGSGHGLASAIIAQALHDADRSGVVVAVDVEPRMVTRAQANLAAYGLDHKVELVQETPLSFCNSRAAQGRTFGFIFVDHSSNYADVLAVSGLLPNLLDGGGFVLFHDFNDRRNTETVNGSYGVYAGVADGLPVPPFAFYGVFGCSGLYRREAVGEEQAVDRSSPILGG